MNRTDPIPLPLRGLAESSSYTDQPEGTAPDLQNVRVVDPKTGRLRLAQRGALAKFNSNTMGSANPVREIVSVVKVDDTVTYTVKSDVTSADLEWQRALPSNREGVSIAVDAQANLYVVGYPASGSGISYLVKYNSAGVKIWTHPIALEDNTHLVKSVKLDEFNDIYVAIGGTSATLPGRVRKYRQLPENAGLIEAWSIVSPNTAQFVDLAVKQGYMYAIENTATYSYLLRYDGVFDTAPRLVWNAIVARPTADTEVAIAVAIAQDGAAVVAVCDTVDPPAKRGRLSKYGPNAPTGGPPVTAIWSVTAQDGVGQAVVSDYAGSLWTCGYGSGGTPTFVTKITDNGSSATVAWSLGTGLTITHFKGVNSIAVDAQGVVFYTISNSGSTNTFARIKADGSAIDWMATTADISAEFYGVAVDPFQADNDTKTEFVYLIGTAVASTNYALHKLRVLTVTTSDASPRSLVMLCACNGNIRKFARGAGASTAPTGGTGALTTTARWVRAASGFNRILWTDGTNYRTYDALTDTVSSWTATGAGQIPTRGRLLEVWNGRAVLAGFENQPHNYAMSAVGDFDDWDFFPPVATATQAVIGNAAESGECPDVINAWIPYSDDLAIVGGDHSIHRMTGDPAANGQFDLISNVTGMAFGRAWAKDDRGVVYFYGSTGGVWALLPGAGPPERISIDIDSRLKAVNIGSTDIRLVWDSTEECLYVLLTPFAGGATTHYVWDRGERAWVKDVYPNAQNPTCVHVSDGDDPADRVLVFGSSDGYVRYMDLDGLDDDGTAITSYAFVGPLRFGGGEIEAVMRDLTAVLAGDSGSMDYSVYAAESPDFSLLPAAAFSGTWAAGRNSPVKDRCRGESVWIKMGRFSNPTSGRWALESLRCSARAGGKVRNR